MIHRRTAIQTNQQRQELQMIEQPSFPLLANAGDIRAFFYRRNLLWHILTAP